MKKLFSLFVIALGLAMSTSAQTPKAETKKTTTPAQKVHNTFSKHKHYKGTKTKIKHADGSKHVEKTNNATGETKVKNKD